MHGKPESPPTTYRAARRAFIAACEKAHIETVSRLHPAKAPDGKPLFMDTAALGPRHAAKAMLVIGYNALGSDILVALARDTKPPAKAQLVLVHALDPAEFAGVTGDPNWPSAKLQAEVIEDLSHVTELSVLTLGRRDERVEPALRAQLSKARITLLPPARSLQEAQGAVTGFLTP